MFSYQSLPEYDKALEFCNKGLRINTKNIDVYYAKSACYTRKMIILKQFHT